MPSAILDKRGSQPEPLSPTMNAIELVGTESELIPNPDVNQEKQNLIGGLERLATKSSKVLEVASPTSI